LVFKKKKSDIAKIKILVRINKNQKERIKMDSFEIVKLLMKQEEYKASNPGDKQRKTIREGKLCLLGRKECGLRKGKLYILQIILSAIESGEIVSVAGIIEKLASIKVVVKIKEKSEKREELLKKTENEALSRSNITLTKFEEGVVIIVNWITGRMAQFTN
jgi:hypothetical protein